MPNSEGSMFKLNPAPKIITFDCYGTLVQWHEVLLREIGAALVVQGCGVAEAAAVLDTFSRHSRRLEVERPHRLYRDILRISFRAALTEHSVAASDDIMEPLAATIPTMGPHPEVPDVLRRLRER